MFHAKRKFYDSGEYFETFELFNDPVKVAQNQDQLRHKLLIG